ncbi:unnamed protein product, partial [marine sediment metagenome]
WQSPTGYVDGESKWGSEVDAYDEDVGDEAWTIWKAAYLELTRVALNCDKVRVYVSVSIFGSPNYDVDVYYSGGWHNIHSGESANKEWVEFAVGSTESITAMRLKHNSGGMGNFQWWEADFNQVAAPPSARRIFITQ